MEYIKGYIGCEQDYLNVEIYDDRDMQMLRQYKDEKNVTISMENIRYLTEFTNVEQLIITPGQAPDNVSEILATQEHLRALKLDYDETEPCTSWCVDISKLKRLEFLFSRSSLNFKGVSGCLSLKTLAVSNWYNESIAQLKDSGIDTLRIGCGRLKCLDGIEQLPLLILSLSHLRFLTDIASVRESHIKILEIDSCNRIENIENLLPATLEYLMLYGKNRISSGAFINQYPQLKRVILDVTIEDSDLSAFDTLDSAILLTDRRSYNRKNSQLPKNDRIYSLQSIPLWRNIYSGRKI